LHLAIFVQAKPVLCQGKTPARIVIESVLPVPDAGQQPQITLRNLGGGKANITAWKLVANGSNSTGGSSSYTIGTEFRCIMNGTVGPGESITFRPQSNTNNCGFSFSLSQE
jgi:hypothetical protein